MAGFNPYEVLGVPTDADEDSIASAYDRLFDHYEAKALAGDHRAGAMLDRLNRAWDILMDPAQRAAFDAKQAASRPAQATPHARAAMTTSTSTFTTKDARTNEGAASAAVKIRRRSKQRPRAVPPRSNFALLPYALLGVLAVAVLVTFAFIVGQQRAKAGAGSLPPPSQSRGEVLATVNGVPIYSRDWEERVAKDKEIALSDPILGGFVNNFEGITGTRALEVIQYDALDKLINLEVIQQQARKEGLYPNEQQQRMVIEDAKKREVPPGETFEGFLKKYNITEEQYNRRVVENLVYTLMATEHVPKTGTNEQKVEGFIRWICETRKNYDVQIYKKFSMQHQPCTSGLPTDLPLPGVEQPTPGPEEQLPLPVETAAPPVAP